MPNVAVAGHELFAAVQAERAGALEAQHAVRRAGHVSDRLVEVQVEQSRRGIRGARLVHTDYGWSVRADSGLQDFALLASARRKQVDGTLEDAERFAKEWVAADPAHRYAWRDAGAAAAAAAPAVLEP